MADHLIVRSKLKDFAKFEGKALNVAGDFAEALTEKVKVIIAEACKRAVENGRSTVMKKDV